MPDPRQPCLSLSVVGRISCTNHAKRGGRVSVVAKFDALVETLDQLTPEVEVLVEAGRSLAWEIDTAPLVNSDEKAKPRSASSAVTALRALMVDLIAKGRSVVANPDEADEDWAAPTVVDLAPVRDAKESGAGDPRPRGRRGGKAAS